MSPGQKIEVDRLSASDGEVEFDKVLLIAQGEKTVVGNPVIHGARVTGAVLGEHKGDKIIVFKYKPKVRYQRKKGHRQTYTSVEIKKITAPGEKEASDGT